MSFSLCLADKPGPPAKVEAIKITYNSIRFRWTAPNDNGRSRISVYRLLAEHPNGTRIVRDYSTPTGNTSLEYTFYNLQENTPYIVSVSAINKAGQGEVKKATFKTYLRGKMIDVVERWFETRLITMSLLFPCAL